MTSWRQRVREVVQENELLKEQLDDFKEQVYCLTEHIKKLEGMIRQRNNENTPSSKKPDWEKKKSPDRVGKEKKPKGKPIGYVEKVACDIPEVAPVKWTRY